MEKIQVELNRHADNGVVYVVTLDPIFIDCGGVLQDDKMRVYDDEKKAQERFSLWKKEAVEYLMSMTENKGYSVESDTPFLYTISSLDKTTYINVRILERILITKDDLW